MSKVVKWRLGGADRGRGLRLPCLAAPYGVSSHESPAQVCELKSSWPTVARST